MAPYCHPYQPRSKGVRHATTATMATTTTSARTARSQRGHAPYRDPGMLEKLGEASALVGVRAEHEVEVVDGARREVGSVLSVVLPEATVLVLADAVVPPVALLRLAQRGVAGKHDEEHHAGAPHVCLGTVVLCVRHHLGGHVRARAWGHIARRRRCPRFRTRTSKKAHARNAKRLNPTLF